MWIDQKNRVMKRANEVRRARERPAMRYTDSESEE